MASEMTSLDPQMLRADVRWVARVYRENYKFVWRTLARLGVANAVLEDALQDVFVVLHRRRDTFEGRASVRTWLYGISIRVARRARERHRRRETVPLPTSATSDREDPENTAIHRQLLSQLDAVLAQLSDEQREVFVLFEIEGLDAKAVANIVGVGRNTVYSRLRLARKNFQLRLAESNRSEGQNDERA